MAGGRGRGSIDMRNLRRDAAFCIGIGLSLFMTACGGGGGGGNTTPPPPTTYLLTVNSTTPASGVAITVSPADNNNTASGTTAFSLTYNAGTSVTLTAPATSGTNTFSTWTGCTSTATVKCTVTVNSSSTVTANYTAAVFPTSVSVNQSVAGPAVTNQLLGMNLASGYDVTGSTNGPAIVSAFQAAGIKAIRWPGGSWSDEYNWET